MVQGVAYECDKQWVNNMVTTTGKTFGLRLVADQDKIAVDIKNTC